jgi:PAS domain S-box-containing protein
MGCFMNPLPDPGEAENLAEPLRIAAEALLSPVVLEAVPDPMVAVNPEGIILQVNSQIEGLFGYTRDELVGQPVEVLVPDRLRQQHHHHREQFGEHPKMRRMGAGLDLYGKRRDGSEFPVEISLSPVPTGNGVIVLSAIRDISDRKRIEEELRRAHKELNQRKDRQLWQSQSRLALIVDSSQDAIIGKSLDGIVTNWNTGAEHIYGYRAEEVIDKSISILAPEERADEIPKILESIRQGRRVENVESVRVTKDGRRLNVSISVSPIHDAEGNIVGASTIARDITAQKRAEEQLRQAQKMEAVGRLAGGIAHDFNNILGIITACNELLSYHLDPAVSPEYVDNIREAAKRGATLTRQLLTFSRKQTAQPQVLDLNERLKDVSKLLRPLMGDDVEVILLPRATSAVVEADPGQLDQLVVNLAVNARDAMPHGGKLILETSTVEVDEAFAKRYPPLMAGSYVMLAISDNGCGMDQATVSRIFEPFFTTKDIGKGSGLGLATVYGIVRQSGGQIWVYSEPAHGTTFKIYLPSAAERVGLAKAPAAQADFPRREGTTILLVDDDEIMRRLTRRMLEAHGYGVVEARDGRSALEQLASSPNAIDLVLTDVVMKGMSGPDLVLHLMESHPQLKVIYMSGYAGELIAGHTPDAAITLLEKPFTRAALLGTLDAALE